MQRFAAVRLAPRAGYPLARAVPRTLNCRLRPVRAATVPYMSGQASETPRETTLLSVVAPVYNEEETIDEFHRRTSAALAGFNFELILVDDGSADRSAEMLARSREADPNVGVVSLSRNFGHQAALTAGLDHARGDVIVMLDADLQDPPELIPNMVEAWSTGADVVYAVRESRAGETRFKLATARWFYKIFSKLTQLDLQHNAGDFRLLDRTALDALLSMRERNRFLRGMSVWVGFDQAAVTYERDAGSQARRSTRRERCSAFSLDAISSFSHLPLQFATLLGFVFSTIAFLAIPVAIGFRIAGAFVPGITTVLLVTLPPRRHPADHRRHHRGVLGRVYDEVKNRPLYVVKDRQNMHTEDFVTELEGH